MIWIVFVGEYSYTTAIACYDTEEVAQKLADAVGGYIEGPYETNKAYEYPPTPGGCFWQVEMKKDGRVVACYGPRPKYEFDGSCKVHSMEYSTLVTNRKWRLAVQIYADDEEHAIKATNEIRTQILAGALPLSSLSREIPKEFLPR